MSLVELAAAPEDGRQVVVPEAAPLLDAEEHHDERPDEGPDEPIPQWKRKSPPRPRRWQARSPGTIVRLIAVIKFCFVTSGMLILIPMLRLIEDAICHAHFNDDSDGLIDEMECKVDEVQSRLAFILGWCGLLNAVTSLVVAFPYGMLADRIGRKPTALLSYGGIAVSFLFAPLMLGSSFKHAVRRNPYLLMSGSAWLLIGGGVHVMMATLYAMAADVSDEKEKAANFLYLTFGATAGGLLGPLLAGVLMEHFGPWLPIYVVICITPLILCLFLFLPETLVINIETERTEYQPPLVAIRAHITKGLGEFRSSLKLLKNPNVLLVLVTFFIQNPRLVAYSTILTQYVSKNFGWKLAETSLLLSPLGVLNLLVIVALPKISKLLTSQRVGYTTFRKDLFLTRASAVIVIVATLVEGFSHNVVIFLIGLFIGTFGAADSPLARATVSHYVESEFTSRLYALIAMAEVLGSAIGGPVLAFFFQKGMQYRGVWMGLPWFYIGFLVALSWVALLFVRSPKQDPWRQESIYCDRADPTVAPENPPRHEEGSELVL